MSEETRKYIKNWKPSEIDGSFKINNFTSELSKLTLRIIVACAFGEEDDSFFNEMASLYEHLIVDFSFIRKGFHFLKIVMMIPLFGKNYLYLPIPSNKRFLENKRKITEKVLKIIEKKRFNKNKEIMGKELLSLMMDAVDENGITMDNQGLIDESLTFLFAGHDTTSGLLSFMFWKLAEFPEVQNKVFKEVKSLNSGGKHLRYEDVEKLTFLNQVVNECLRMYPPAISVAKIATADFEIMDYPILKDVRW
jgi:cytochrome P450